ncbi:unnamed protein product [Ectocarpus sp. 4 AP-2014]
MGAARPSNAAKKQKTKHEELIGTDNMLLDDKTAISDAYFAVRGKRIKSFATIGSSIESKSFSAESPNHKVFRAEDEDGEILFVKMNTTSDAVAKFNREIEGLHSIRLTRTVRVPRVIALANLPERRGAALILEYVKMETMSTEEQRKFGEKLARMHIICPKFGYFRNTWCGESLQINHWEDDWCNFFSKHRLGQQAEMILEKHGDHEVVAKVEKLRVNLRERFFKDLKITPSLLHGNLWSRNWGVDDSGKPVIYDPAVCFGHYEMEMSMLTMFGSPCKGFFVKYHDLLPREEPGYQDRIMLYQLYHYLNLYLQHGRGFRSPCMALVKTLLTPSIPSGSSSG